MAGIEQHIDNDLLIQRIGQLIDQARRHTLAVVNTTMVYTYYEIGRMIVEDEQQGQHRADYGKQVLKNVAKQLTAKYGKGFSYTNLKQMRQFYLSYSELDRHCLTNLESTDNKPIPKFTLSWSHYLKLMRINNPDERRFYEIEATNNNWSFPIRDTLRSELSWSHYMRLISVETMPSKSLHQNTKPYYQAKNN